MKKFSFLLLAIFLSQPLFAQTDTYESTPYPDLTIINCTPRGLDLIVTFSTDFRDTSTYRREIVHITGHEGGRIFCGMPDMPDTLYFSIALSKKYAALRKVATKYDEKLEKSLRDLVPTYFYKNGVRFHLFGRHHKDRFFIWSIVPCAPEEANKKPFRA
jgi:hypothetical protein